MTTEPSHTATTPAPMESEDTTMRPTESPVSNGSAATVIHVGPRIPCRITTEYGEEIMMMQPKIILQDIEVIMPPNDGAMPRA